MGYYWFFWFKIRTYIQVTSIQVMTGRKVNNVEYGWVRIGYSGFPYLHLFISRCWKVILTRCINRMVHLRAFFASTSIPDITLLAVSTAGCTSDLVKLLHHLTRSRDHKPLNPSRAVFGSKPWMRKHVQWQIAEFIVVHEVGTRFYFFEIR